MIADMISSKKFNQIVTDLFIRGKKLNISSVFITQSYFKALEDVRLNCTYSFMLKIPKNKNLNKLHLIIHQL